MIFPRVNAPLPHPMSGTQMKSHTPHHKESSLHAICPYATGFHRHICCKLINSLPVEVVLRLCEIEYVGCDEYHNLKKQEQCAATQAHRVQKIRRVYGKRARRMGDHRC